MHPLTRRGPQYRTEGIRVKQMKAAHLIFTSPEAVISDEWWNILRRRIIVNICCLVIDEAHCLMEWPTIFLYMERTKFREFDNAVSWFMPEFMELKEHLPTTIIDCRTIDEIGKVYGLLIDALDKIYAGPKNAETRIAEMFHGESTLQTKERVLRRFMDFNSTLRCVVATVGFGMGVNVPDIRNIINWGAPSDTITYWQEVGRAGRDGKGGKAFLYLFPYSVNKKVVSDEFRDVIKQVTKYNVCIRSSVLRCLQVGDMDMENWRKPDNCCTSCKD